MGRHHVKLPDHLYLSPPSPQPSSSSLTTAAASLLSLRAGSSISPTALIQETSSTARAVGDKIPGFRTSAAFLTTLRANIYLDVEYPESLTSTPDCLRPTNMASSVSSLASKETPSENNGDFAPPAALSLPKPTLSEDAPEADLAETSDPNGVPLLTTFAAVREKDRVEALHIVADSVAQQRQRSSRLLIFHPITIAIIVALFAIVYQFLPHERWGDFSLIGTTCGGILMTVLISIRAMTGEYLQEAERVGTWRWLDQGRSRADEAESGKKVLGDEDEIIITKFGAEIIGAVIFRGVQSSSSAASSNGSKKHKKSNSVSSSTNTNSTKVEIRAWTVRQKYRNKGVGTALLEDAIKSAHEKGWDTENIEISADHANSKRVLPEMFNGGMTAADEKTRAFLDQKVSEFQASNAGEGKKGKKRR